MATSPNKATGIIACDSSVRGLSALDAPCPSCAAFQYWYSYGDSRPNQHPRSIPNSEWMQVVVYGIKGVSNEYPLQPVCTHYRSKTTRASAGCHSA